MFNSTYGWKESEQKHKVIRYNWKWTEGHSSPNWSDTQLWLWIARLTSSRHMGLLLCLALFLWAWEIEEGRAGSQSKQQLYPQMLTKNILILKFPVTSLSSGNLAVWQKAKKTKKKNLRHVHANKPISNHTHSFNFEFAYGWIVVMGYPAGLISNQSECLDLFLPFSWSSIILCLRYIS